MAGLSSRRYGRQHSTLALCGVLASPDGIDRQWLRHQEPPSAATIYPRLMSDDASAQSMISRLRAAAAEYDPAKERATMEPVWEMASSTDKGLRTCLMENSIAVLGAVRLKRRLRAQALEEITSTACSGYILARYLLGTGAHRPTYSQSDPESEKNAYLINHRSSAYEFNDVIWSLDGGNKVLIKSLGSMRGHSPLLGIMGEEQGTATFLASYCFGISCALAEEEIFGPLS